jgi:cytochrome oxidase assembly protein ShyY1
VRLWRRAFSWRSGAYFALALVFAAICVSLGTWQLGRRDEALQEISHVQANFDREPVEIHRALPRLDSFDGSQKWLPVMVSGSYIADAELLVRNRSLNGHPGFRVLAPFRIDDGSVFVVDRGWLPTGSKDDIPDSVPQLPPGRVTVIARLKAGEPSLNRTAPEGQIPTIELASVRDRIKEPTYTAAYGLLDTENPAPANRPTEVDKPTADEGPHLSYAFQWFLFGALGFVGFGYALREEGRAANAGDPAELERAGKRESRRSSRRSDAEIEDEILGVRSAPTREK